MVQPRIGLDLDSVLADFFEFVKFYNNKHETDFKFNELTEYDLCNILNISGDYLEDMFKEFYFSNYHHNTPVVDGARKGVEELSKDYELHVITSRPYYSKNVTLKWIEENFNGFFKDVHFSSHFSLSHEGTTKEDICSKLDIKYMVEDCLYYAVKCAEVCDVYLIDYPWNQRNGFDLSSRIYRVNNWDEIIQDLVTK